MQAYILSIPMGSSIPNAYNDTVTLRDFLWEFYQTRHRLCIWVSNYIFNACGLECVLDHLTKFNFEIYIARSLFLVPGQIKTDVRKCMLPKYVSFTLNWTPPPSLYRVFFYKSHFPQFLFVFLSFVSLSFCLFVLLSSFQFILSSFPFIMCLSGAF